MTASAVTPDSCSGATRYGHLTLSAQEVRQIRHLVIADRLRLGSDTISSLERTLHELQEAIQCPKPAPTAETLTAALSGAGKNSPSS